MLILSRQAGQEIIITGGISIKIVDIDRGKVRVGITAPSEVEVWRRELLDEDGKLPSGGRKQ